MLIENSQLLTMSSAQTSFMRQKPLEITRMYT